MKLNKGTGLFTLVAGFVGLWTTTSQALNCTGTFTDQTTNTSFKVAVTGCSWVDSCSCQTHPAYNSLYGNVQAEGIVTCGSFITGHYFYNAQGAGNDTVVVSSCAMDSWF